MTDDTALESVMVRRNTVLRFRTTMIKTVVDIEWWVGTLTSRSFRVQESV